MLATKEYADRSTGGLPDGARRPARPRDGGQGGRAGRGPDQEFRGYAEAVADNAQTLADGLLRRGARLVTGGTDNHLVLIDVSASG